VRTAVAANDPTGVSDDSLAIPQRLPTEPVRVFCSFGGFACNLVLFIFILPCEPV
jgi:hypothetical protein